MPAKLRVIREPQHEDTETTLVWGALADPTRRRILDLLRRGPQTTGAIAQRFPISRIAVMRHLDVLAESGLVVNRKRGRERWHYLNSVPLRRIHERWVGSLDDAWAAASLRLQAHVARAMSDSPTKLAVDIAFDIDLAGSPQKVFRALTTEVGAWWGHPYLGQNATGLTLEPRVGGQLLELWDKGGRLLATVTALSPDRLLELTGAFHLGVVHGVVTYELEPKRTGTLLRFSHRAFGAVEEGIAEQFAGGWRELIGVRLKTFVETGVRSGIKAKAATAERGRTASRKRG